ncbi:unnamed protein product [Aspergillus oryzae]|nr:unnamed protein product [Aspergillus oryzae]
MGLCRYAVNLETLALAKEGRWSSQHTSKFMLEKFELIKSTYSYLEDRRDTTSVPKSFPGYPEQFREVHYGDTG